MQDAKIISEKKGERKRRRIEELIKELRKTITEGVMHDAGCAPSLM